MAGLIKINKSLKLKNTDLKVVHHSISEKLNNFNSISNLTTNINNNSNNIKSDLNLIYEKIWEEKISPYISKINTVALNDINILLTLTEPHYVCHEIYQTIEYFLKKVCTSEANNYLEDYKEFIEAIIYDEIIADSINNFQNIHAKIKININNMQEYISPYKFTQESHHISYRDKLLYAFKSKLMDDVYSSMKEPKKLKDINKISKEMFNNISNIIKQEFISDIKNIFNRTVQILPFLSYAIDNHNLFLILTEKDNTYKTKTLKNIEEHILSTFNKSTLFDLIKEYVNYSKLNIANYLISNVLFDNDEDFEVYYYKGIIKYYIKELPILSHEDKENYLKEAYDYLYKAYKLNNEDTNLLSVYSRALVDLEDYNSAIYIMNTLISNYPDKEEYYEDRFIVLYKAKRYMESYRAILKLKEKFGADFEREKIIECIKQMAQISTKSWKTTFILSIFSPLHMFYTGKYIHAIIYLFILTLFFANPNPSILVNSVWWFFDLLTIIFNKYKDGKGKHIIR